MTKFRKKPVTIHAYQWMNDGDHNFPTWISAAFARGDIWYQGGDDPHLTIKTLEGDHRANIGDWIIRGIAGELYPCKPDIFEQTYEPI